MNGLVPDATTAAVFLAGLLGGGHCAAMCGGIVGALSAQRDARLALLLAYNAGRIASYAAAGTLAGTAGAFLLAKDVLPLQVALYVAANLILLAMGTYLAGWSRLITRLEAPGRWLWRRISPWTGRFLPADTVPRALAVGMLWGWLPCGLTYSILAISLMSGSGAGGAATMAAFGLGTLPNLLLAGFLLRGLLPLLRKRAVRWIAGAAVFSSGMIGLAQAAGLAGHLRRGLLCLT